MKRFFYAVLAAAATLSFAACKEEVDNTTPEPLGDKVVAFTLQKTETRSAAGTSTASRNERLPLGVIDGQAIFLEETVTSLDDVPSVTPETRGTPLYSENFLTISGGSFKGLAFPAADMTDKQPSDASWPEGDFEYTPRNQWERQYEWDPWFGQDALLVYAKMLTEYSGAASGYGGPIGVLPNSYRYSYSATAGQSMSFSYRSPLTAQEQQDILFAARSVTSQEAKQQIPIIFYHALTGVKFATAHTNEEDVKTYIKKVELTGIYGYGKCTITSTAENGGYSDDPTVHSSANAVSWSNLRLGGGTTANANQAYTQEFADTPVTFAEGGSFANNGDYPSSFSSAGNQRNLNDADASLTFWLIPQTLTSVSKLKVTFEIEINGNRKEYTRVLQLGELTNYGEWKAGQLRTYTLKSSEVDVEIEDVVENHVKKDVVISNVGNAPAYIRAQIVGSWYGKAGNQDGVAMGFTSSDENNFDYVKPWNDVLNTSSEYVPYGTFVGLPGTDWVQGTDGYFYYTKIVMPGEETGSKLFTTYTLDTSLIPTIYYVNIQPHRVAFTDVRLVIDIPVQGVIAPLAAGSTVENPQYQDHKAAWAAAGVTAPDAVTP